MSALPYDLVILDLDGTIIDLYQPGVVSHRVRQTLAAVQEAGVPVTIGTGRTLAYIRHQLGYLNLTTPVVTTQGAVIGDPQSGAILHRADLPWAATQRVLDFMDARRTVCAFYFYDHNGEVCIEQNQRGDMAEEFYNYVLTMPRTIHANLAERFASAKGAAPTKFLSVNDRSIEEDIAPLLQAELGEQLTIVRTHPLLVEGTAAGVDKGYGVRQLCSLLNIDPQRVLAIGDAENDIPMLQTVGMAVAMGNATPTVKAVAHWIAPSIEEDGVAVALQTLLLDKIRC